MRNSIIHIQKYCVVGNPIEHSLSPKIHTLFARQTGQNICYTKHLIPMGQFKPEIYKLINEGYKGCNITLPFKEDAFDLADTLSDRAKAAKAVNTFIFSENGKIHGDNTDGVGLVRDLTHRVGLILQDKNILVLGAGGATRGILQPLLEMNPKAITVANRTLAKANTLVNEFAVQATSLKVDGYYDLIINATSVGVKNESINIPNVIIDTNTIVYDLMYSQTQTPFLRHYAAQGAKTFDGIGMLIEQAAESFTLWEEKRPDTNLSLHDIVQ